MSAPRLHDYLGAIHLHSAHSHDGRRTVAEIARAAEARGLDFVLISDHFNLKAKELGEDGWHGSVLVVAGEEVSPRYNHLLVFGLREALIPQRGETTQGLIERVRAAGGLSFLAHPDHKGTTLFKVPSYRWTEWGVTGWSGLSVWDAMTDWQNRLTSLPRAVAAWAAPALALRGPEPETLERWDELGRGRRVAGLGELDNHEFHHRLGGLTFRVFPFETAFRLVLTHVLLEGPWCGEAREDEAALLGALAAGRAYVCLEALGEGRGFEFHAEMGGRTLQMGEEAPLAGEAELVVRSPRPARISLLRDGVRQAEVFGRELRHAARRPGVWRVECRLRRWGRWRPWVFSNPIYLR